MHMSRRDALKAMAGTAALAALPMVRADEAKAAPAAAAVPQVAGASGGADEAVEDGVTGVVVRRPTEAGDVARAIGRLLDDPVAARRMGKAARLRAEASFDYDLLAPRLASSLGDTRS